LSENVTSSSILEPTSADFRSGSLGRQPEILQGIQNRTTLNHLIVLPSGTPAAEPLGSVLRGVAADFRNLGFRVILP
jgi:hypothetical protein